MAEIGGSDNALMAAAEAAGAVGGAVGGAAAGAAAAEALMEGLGFTGEDYKSAKNTAVWIGGAIGGLLGGVAGGFAGDAVARAFFTAKDFVPPGGGREGTLKSCVSVLGLDTSSSISGGYVFTATEIKAAFKTQARKLHPDRGGTQEDFVRLQFCKEALLATAAASTSTGSS